MALAPFYKTPTLSRGTPTGDLGWGSDQKWRRTVTLKLSSCLEPSHLDRFGMPMDNWCEYVSQDGEVRHVLQVWSMIGFSPSS